MKSNHQNISHAKILLTLIGVVALIGLFVVTGPHDTSFGSSVTGNAPGPRITNLPSCIKDWENEPMLTGVVAYLKDSRNSNVIRAWNPCANVPDILQRIKRGLIEAETRRINEGIQELPDVPLPDTWYTTDTSKVNYVSCGDQAHEIIAMKVVAHILVDYWDLVQWNLWDYGAEDLERLFTDAPEYDTCNYYNVLDYSPREAWSILSTKFDIASITTPLELSEKIMMETRTYRHGGIWVYPNGTIFKQDNLGIQTMQGMSLTKVSRQGCQSMTYYYLYLASVFNVPSSRVGNYYSFEPGHASWISPFAGLALAHGDDPYDGMYGDTPAPKVFNDYSFWKREVMKKNPTITSRQKSLLHEYEMGRTYPSYYIMNNYCHYTFTSAGKSYPSGRDFLRYVSTRGGFTYWTELELDELEATINLKTQNCAFIPPNDPENI